MHTHYQEEKCYEDGIFFYHLGCHQWVSGAELAPPGTPEGKWPLCFCQGLRRVTHAPTVGLWAEATRSCLELASGGVAALEAGLGCCCCGDGRRIQ